MGRRKNFKKREKKGGKRSGSSKTSSCGMPLICLHHGAEDRRRLKRRPGARSPPTRAWRPGGGVRSRPAKAAFLVESLAMSSRGARRLKMSWSGRGAARTYCQQWHALRAARQFHRGPPRPILSRRPRVNRMKWANSAFSSPWWEKKHGFRKSENFPARVGG